MSSVPGAVIRRDKYLALYVMLLLKGAQAELCLPSNGLHYRYVIRR